VNGVFLDTVGMIAVWDTSDQWHAAAEAAFSELLRDNVPLLTTNYVLLECGNAASRRPYRRRVAALRSQLRDARLLVDPTEEELEAAWLAYDRGEAGEAGIVDHVSFVVMRRLGLKRALTNDGHFPAAGFETCW
jgi:predicted nucleic acid-binding protein